MKYSQAEIIANNLRTIDAHGHIAFVIAYNIRQIDDELQEYYEFKRELFKKYGREKDGQLSVDLLTENGAKFVEEVTPFDNEEFEPKFKMLTEEELEKADLKTAEFLYLMNNFMQENKEPGGDL